MNILLSLLKKRALLTLGGVAFLSIFIWYIAPLLSVAGIAPLQSVRARLLAIGLLLAGWAVITAWRFWRAKKRNEQVLKSIAEDTQSTAQSEAQDAETATLKAKMDEAVAVLGRQKFTKSGSKKFLYELPWYLLIGPPGAGKTTLLSNSELDFPLEESSGKYSIKGVGGTRNCDWWFTDSAVILDTAGRYTTQDSDADIDKSAWETFLQLLKDTRSRRPVNGLIVALSLQDIVNSPEDKLTRISKNIRFRIEEISDRFGMRAPVYLVITKCDLLDGFSQYFADYDTEKRHQVWGFTLGVDEKTQLAARAEEELSLLTQTLFQQLVTKLHDESALSRRDDIYKFPENFSAATASIVQFVEQLCTESPLQEDVYLRGLYLTSATQDGSALSRIAGSLSTSFGFPDNQPTQVHNQGKSFFIHKLLKQVIFSEAGLAGTNLAGEKRNRRLQIATVSGVAALTLLSLLLWGLSYQRNATLLQNTTEQSQRLKTDLDSLASNSLDLGNATNVLNEARALIPVSAEQPSLTRGLGLYQGKKIEFRAHRKYRQLLSEVLLSRLIVRLEHQMHSESDNSEFLFEALKTYQMLDNENTYDAEDVIGWYRFDYERNLPSSMSTQQKNKLIAHTESLFEEKPRLPRPLDNNLINQYQKIAAQTPLATRAYWRLKQQNADLVNSSLKLTTLAGADLAQLLRLEGEQSFNDFIPEFFSVDSYRNRVLAQSPTVAQSLETDRWVLGAYNIEPTTQNSLVLSKAVLAQYYKDYQYIWDELLQVIRLRKTSTMDELTEFIALLTDADSPLKNLLLAVAEQTRLTVDTEESESDESDTNERQKKLNAIVGNALGQTERLTEQIDPVTEHFEPLNELVDNWQSNSSKLQSTLNSLADLNVQLLAITEKPGAATDPALTGELKIKLRQLEMKAGRLPAPVSTLVAELTSNVADATSGGYCAQLNIQWQTEVYPFYQRALQNRYPLNRRASTEITLEDFGKFFASGGILDRYVSSYLAGNVVKNPGTWSWVGSEVACLSENTLRQLALADDIRQTFFQAGNGATQAPVFSFNLNPANVSMDGSIDHLYLTLAGRSSEFFHGPVKGSTRFQWPGSNGEANAAIRIEPVIPGLSAQISHNGPWAILRLLDQGKKRQRNSSTTSVKYNFSGRQVALEFNSSSFNPLASTALRNFRCPESL